MKVCKHCGQLNTNDCDFCCNCGKRDFVVQEEIACPHCGAVNDKSFAFCINCGGKMQPDVVDIKHAAASTSDEGFTPSPVDARERFSDVYGGMSVATPQETAKCPTCGAIIPIHAIYCSKCGTSVATLHDHRVVKRKICSHCGRPNSLEARFCSYCFATLVNAATQDMQVVHDSKTLGSGSIKQTFLQDGDGKKKICANCGALNAPDEVFCVSCGFKLDCELQKKYCPNCGVENSPDDKFCTRCQWSFEGNNPDTQEKWVCSKCKNINNASNVYCVACGAKRQTGRKG